MTLDNADGWLPIDFAEVTIGRRAYRSGEAEYLINGARVRLRDIVELLAAGQLGASSLVIVGQGTVDAALSLRPEERRQLFEEAAGVKNLQVRKNEALGRLSRAEENLTRVKRSRQRAQAPGTTARVAGGAPAGARRAGSPRPRARAGGASAARTDAARGARRRSSSRGGRAVCRRDAAQRDRGRPGRDRRRRRARYWEAERRPARRPRRARRLARR